MMRPAEIARLAKVSEGTVRRWRHEGRLDFREERVVYLEDYSLEALRRFVREVGPVHSLRFVQELAA